MKFRRRDNENQNCCSVIPLKIIFKICHETHPSIDSTIQDNFGANDVTLVEKKKFILNAFFQRIMGMNVFLHLIPRKDPTLWKFTSNQSSECICLIYYFYIPKSWLYKLFNLICIWRCWPEEYLKLSILYKKCSLSSSHWMKCFSWKVDVLKSRFTQIWWIYCTFSSL